MATQQPRKTPVVVQQKKKTSPWIWILGGCLLFIVVAVVGVVVFLYFGAKKMASAVEENVKNPTLRAKTAKKMLGAARLPDGYYPISGTFDIPFLSHVELSDRAPDKNGAVVGFDKRGFIYTDTFDTESSRKLESFFSGADNAPEMIEDVGVSYRARETLRKGTLTVGNETIRYRTSRGRVGKGQSEVEGLLTTMWIDCPGQKRERYAVWFGPDATPSSSSTSGEAALAGTVGDEAALRQFMSQFDFCRKR